MGRKLDLLQSFMTYFSIWRFVCALRGPATPRDPKKSTKDIILKGAEGSWYSQKVQSSASSMADRFSN